MASGFSATLINQLNNYVPNWYKLQLGSLLSKAVADQVVAYTSSAAMGSDTSETFTVTGLAATDKILGIVCNSGGSGVAANGWATQATNSLVIKSASNMVENQTFSVIVSKAANPDT